jgi:hypothetical protein
MVDNNTVNVRNLQVGTWIGTKGRAWGGCLERPNKRAWYLPDDDGTSIEFEEKLKKIKEK